MTDHTMKAIVSIEFKSGVLDPEATAIGRSLNALGFDQVLSVRRVRQLELSLNAQSEAEAREAAVSMCNQLLANPVIETYTIDIQT